MPLYYRDPWCQVWNEDARDLRFLADTSVHLVLTCPPWWDSGDYGHKAQIGFGQTREAYLDALIRVWEECRRCLQPGCAIILWMEDMYWREISVPLVADAHRTLQQAGFGYEATYYWQERSDRPLPEPHTCLPMTARPKEQASTLLVYRKPGARTPPYREIVHASRIDPREYRDSLRSVWTPETVRDDPYARLIRLWSYVGDVVLDPFAGQGAISVFAKKNGRKTIAVELNPDICVHTAERLRETPPPSSGAEKVN